MSSIRRHPDSSVPRSGGISPGQRAVRPLRPSFAGPEGPDLETGCRAVLGVETGASEAETFWLSLLRNLADRGLRGVKLVIADDHGGLRSAASRAFAGATLQRCRVHWMRNALDNVPADRRLAVRAMLKTIFAEESQGEAGIRGSPA